MPPERASFPFHRAFTREEAATIAAGVTPRDMDGKWLIFLEGDRLCFHRAWTGYCYFEARFTERDGVHQIVEAWVNRDPGQIGIDGGDEVGAGMMLNRVIDGVLLRRSAC